MNIKDWIKALWEHFPAVFIIIMDIIFVVMMVIEWDDPVFGFAHFGPIVFISALFPMIWVILYIFGHKKGPQPRASNTTSPNINRLEESN